MMRFAAFLFATAIGFGAVTYTYDSAGRLATVDYGNGQTITYTYDAAGNLLTRTVQVAGSSSNSAAQKKTKAKSDTKETKKDVKTSDHAR